MADVLRDYGWDDGFAEAFRELETQDLQPARVTRSAAAVFRVRGESYSGQATLAGRLRHAAETSAELPTVGDWVGIRAVKEGDVPIEALLPRRSALSRKVAGKRAHEQVVAANVDIVVVVMGLDGDFNLRRLERYLTAIRQSGAKPLVLLNKSDLCAEPEQRVAEVEGVAVGVEVLLASCKRGQGLDAVRAGFAPGRTGVLVGSSGAGKSTLINLLLGESVQRTKSVREDDDRGRHTTTHRELFLLPGGGLLIDSPGIRELHVWADERSLAQAFGDIEEIASGCRFRDCSHQSEKDCAVLAAVDSGSLDPHRLENYRTLQKELRYLELKQDETAQRAEKKKWREIKRDYKRFVKKRGR